MVPALRYMHERFGISRVVLPRVLSILQVQRLCENSPVPREMIAFSRLPLACSARCFTARALDVARHPCKIRCIEYADGMPPATREGKPFLRINGVQIQGEESTDLGLEPPVLRELGVDVLRLYPEYDGTSEVITLFDLARHARVAPPRLAMCTSVDVKQRREEVAGAREKMPSARADEEIVCARCRSRLGLRQVRRALRESGS